MLFATANLGPLMLKTGMWAALMLYLIACACQSQAQEAVHALRRARWFLTVGAVVFAQHTAAAFHFFHGWNHEAAAATMSLRLHDLLEIRSSALLYVIYLFGLVWLAEVVWSWAALNSWAGRPAWMAWPIRVFLAGFGAVLAVWVGGVSAYEVAPLQWSLPGLAVAAGLCWLAGRRLARQAPERA